MDYASRLGSYLFWWIKSDLICIHYNNCSLYLGHMAFFISGRVPTQRITLKNINLETKGTWRQEAPVNTIQDNAKSSNYSIKTYVGQQRSPSSET